MVVDFKLFRFHNIFPGVDIPNVEAVLKKVRHELMAAGVVTYAHRAILKCIII